jgi:hypothetical protein
VPKEHQSDSKKRGSMKIFKYITLIAFMICNNYLLAMEEQTAVEDIQKESAQEKKAVATIEKLRKKQPEFGAGIKIFGSDENPISLALEKNDIGEWYPTANALTKLLNTYEPLKEYRPGIPKVMVEKSSAIGNRNIALFVAYRDENKSIGGVAIKGKPLFFLKVSISDYVYDIPKRLDALQKGPVGRFGRNALSNRELPIIVLQEMFFIYKGNDNKAYTIEVMHLAHGQQLSNIIDSNDFALIQRSAEKVGKALGLFHIYFMNYNNSNSPTEWTTMLHGDFHYDNVFLDNKTSRVYFIDNASMCTGKPLKDFDLLLRLVYRTKNYSTFLLYVIKGYLSAYPTDKKIIIAKYLKTIISEPQFLKSLDEILTEIM